MSILNAKDNIMFRLTTLIVMLIISSNGLANNKIVSSEKCNFSDWEYLLKINTDLLAKKTIKLMGSLLKEERPKSIISLIKLK